MNKFLLCVLLLSGRTALAYPCPPNFAQQADMQKLQSWLAKFQGQFDMKGCHVEITACDPTQSGGDSLLGEVYLIDRNKREVYLPLLLVPDGNPKIKTGMTSSARIIDYYKIDTFYEPELGRQETYQLEMRLSPDGSTVRRLDLATYSTNKALHQPNGNMSRWWNCGDSAD